MDFSVFNIARLESNVDTYEALTNPVHGVSCEKLHRIQTLKQRVAVAILDYINNDIDFLKRYLENAFSELATLGCSEAIERFKIAGYWQ